MEYHNLIEEFLSKEKSLIIAPAGYGKTYTIVECVKQSDGKSLILTHTHAGVAAIKKKLFEKNIDKNKYTVETITSYAQKYVKSYFSGQIPEVTKNDDYWNFILEKAKIIFESKHIQDVIKKSYNRLFVDEYQDCTKLQHSMLMTIAEIVPIHILGDPLQGIMDFKNNNLVDFESDLDEFKPEFTLEIPHRWQQTGNNKELGDFLVSIRDKLEDNRKNGAKNGIKLNELSHFLTYIKTDTDIYDFDFYKPTNNYKKKIRKYISNIDNKSDYNSLLIIVPEYNDHTGRKRGGIVDRNSLKKQIDLANKTNLIEAIDEPSFYSIAMAADNLILTIERSKNPYKKIKTLFLEKLFGKTALNDWIGDNCLKNKRDEKKVLGEKFKKIFNDFIKEPNPKFLYLIVVFLKNQINNYKRQTLLIKLLCALNSELANDSVLKSMIQLQNKIRQAGRKIDGKCIGTTLLTKGLEFDTVIILDAHRMKCPKNLYVAMTRACKNLIIFSKNDEIKPYKIT